MIFLLSLHSHLIKNEAEDKMGIPIDIGDRHFDSKAAAEKYLRCIIGKYKGDIVSDEADDAFLRAAVERHHNAREKVGPGIDFFFIDKGPNHSRDYCIYIYRIDDSIIDISYKKMITTPSKRDEALKAMRCEIKGQIMARRRNLGADPSHHLHHEPAFIILVEEFLRDRGLNLEEIDVANVPGSSSDKMFLDRDLAKEWSRYHEDKATLTLVDKVEHLRRARCRLDHRMM